MKTVTKLWIGLLVMIILTPLGLILPAKFGAGSAWGEWSSEEISKLVGYIPSGMAKTSDAWKAPMPDYALPGQEEASVRSLSFTYILSGVIGVGTIAVVMLLVGKALAKSDNTDYS